MSLIEEFTSSYKNVPNEFINTNIEKGKKVVGYICTLIPEEIIYAAGVLPIRIIPYGHNDTTLADGYMTNLNCSFSRNVLDKVFHNDYDFLEGVVFCNSCDHMRRMSDNWRFKKSPPFVQFMSIPHLGDQTAIKWFKEEIIKFKKSLEAHFGVDITDDKLRSVIRTYNRTRDLLRKLYDFRKLEAPKIWGHEVVSILGAAMVYPKEEFNKKLESFLEKLDDKKGIENLPRIMIIGSEIDDPEYIKLIEDQNSIVVSDYNCFGLKYFAMNVDENKDPIDALTERYLFKHPCPRGLGPKLGHNTRLEIIKNLIKDYYIDGVILERIKMCDLWAGETYLLDNELRDLGVPTLILEREYFLSGIGQTKTRIQAFLEML
ncbi:MAG: 2-hydroxyacyl-CoA dehydratase subunit D [Candidatus Helarchaeota archaeon]